MTSKNIHTPSLSEVNASIDVRHRKSTGRKILAFFGPAYLVSVGYMDPGNWATDLAGGSQFGYALLWVLLMSNLIALLLQSLSARLGIVRGLDLAQASREIYSPFTNTFLYILAEIAIAACDLAEVLGMAIGLQLLFDLPLAWGVCISVLDTFLLLFLLNYGMRKLEAFIISLIFIIASSFVFEMFFAKPIPSEMLLGFIPSIPNDTALYIAIGIIGATVMPHNLYLHSSLVQTRKFERIPTEIRKAIKFNIFDSAIALNIAFFVNAAILILAASTFYKNGLFEVAEIQDAHKLLEPMLGTSLAPILFAVALIAAGQSSTITGTLAGQIVMEGYLNLRIQPWIRRLLTRVIAIVPALFVINIAGESATGKLLVLSQVILSLQLGFAIVPLIHFVSDKKKMGDFVIKPYIKFIAWLSATIIVSLNVKLVYGFLQEWISTEEQLSPLHYIVLFVALFCGFMLLYITFMPLIRKGKTAVVHIPHGSFASLQKLTPHRYKRIAITIDFSKSDTTTINHALAQGGNNAEYLLIHVVETVGAIMLGQDVNDLETGMDKKNLQLYADNIIELGYNCDVKIGFGNPKSGIPVLVNEFRADLLVMGAHGHKGIKDIILGTTVDAVRHRVNIPVLIVR